MDTLKLDTSVATTNVSRPPSTTSSNSSSPSSLTRSSDSTRPCGLSRHNSQSDETFNETASSTSSFPTPTVKFAPLPSVGPRKRRSNQPLGMAARAQLVRKQRGRQGQGGGGGGRKGELVISSSPMWTSAELEEQRMRIEVMAARHAEFQARENAREVSRHCDEVGAAHDDGDDCDGDEGGNEQAGGLEDGVEDAILVFGKIVKGAGKTIWKRIRSKERRPSGAAAPQTVQERRPWRELSPLPILIKSERPSEREQNGSDQLETLEDEVGPMAC